MSDKEKKLKKKGVGGGKRHQQMLPRLASMKTVDL